MVRSSRRENTANGCQGDPAYEYIEEYHVVPSARKNNYFSSHPVPLSQQQQHQSRSESPYQDMSSAKAGPSLPHTKTHDAEQPSCNAAFPVPNNDMLVTPGGSVVYRSRGSASSSTEGDDSGMQSPRSRDLARCSVTLPENALPYNGQPNGEYVFSEC